MIGNSNIIILKINTDIVFEHSRRVWDITIKHLNV